MSDVSSVNNSNTEQNKGWGAISGTIWALVAFIGPQFVIAPLLPLLAGLAISDNAKTFTLHASVELVTLFVLFLIIHRYGLRLSDIGLGKWKLSYLGWALLGLPVYFTFSSVVVSLAGLLLPTHLVEEQQQLGFTAGGTPFELSLIFIALVVVTPLVEETIFRGFLLRGYRKLGMVVATLLVSGLFALAHMQVNVGIDVFVLSLVLCYVRLKTDSLWPAILIHAFKNFIAFYLLFIMGLSS
jgi:membrane protease YdiL (CAAX protease family)